MLPQALRAPITTIDQAYAWIKGLAAAELSFHFDDGPREIISFETKAPLFTDEECDIIEARLEEIYDFDCWGADICPIGVLLMYEGADGYILHDMEEYRLRGLPTPSKAVVCYDEAGITIADRYCTPGAEPDRRFEVSHEGKVLGVFHLFEDALTFAKS